jgi:hypothetical protein
MKTVPAPATPLVPTTPAPASAADLEKASPEAIKEEIARTRAHMDERLYQLGRKMRPRLEGRYLWLPLAIVAAFLAGSAAYLLARRASHPKAGPTVTRFKVRTAGMIDHIRTLQLAASVLRKGKPAILIVEPRKS